MWNEKNTTLLRQVNYREHIAYCWLQFIYTKKRCELCNGEREPRAHATEPTNKKWRREQRQ